MTGATLKQILQQGALEAQQFLNIARQMAEGLQEAHRAGVFHGDVKPANIMLDTRSHVKILDFGEGAYQTYVRQSGDTFRLSDGLTLERRDGTISMAHRGSEVKQLRYARNVVSWSVDDGNASNGCIYFFRKRGAFSEPATNRFFGKIGEADQTPTVRSNWLGCGGG